MMAHMCFFHASVNNARFEHKKYDLSYIHTQTCTHKHMDTHTKTWKAHTQAHRSQEHPAFSLFPSQKNVVCY